MSKKQPKRAKEDKSPIGNFDIKINEFGELKSNIKIDKLNEFLNENVEDKKLRNRNDQTSEEE